MAGFPVWAFVPCWDSVFKVQPLCGLARSRAAWDGQSIARSRAKSQAFFQENFRFGGLHEAVPPELCKLHGAVQRAQNSPHIVSRAGRVSDGPPPRGPCIRAAFFRALDRQQRRRQQERRQQRQQRRRQNGPTGGL